MMIKQHPRTMSALVEKIVPIILMLVVSATNLTAENGSPINDPDFQRVLNSNSYSLTLREGKLSGTGFKWLIDQGKDSQFFLIGERHGTSETVQVATELYRALLPHQYHYFAFEFSPLAAMKVGEIVSSGKYEALERFLTSDIGSGAIAFLGYIPEAKLAAEVVMTSPAGKDALWGLDQEFVFGFAMALQAIYDNSTNDEQRNAVLSLLNRATDNRELLIEIKDTELETLRDVMLTLDHDLGVWISEQLILTRKIYAPYMGRGGYKAESQILREENMMRNFTKYMQKHSDDNGVLPKTIFKLGGFHSGIGVDAGLGRLNFGAAPEVWAITQGTSAFNLFIDCYSGVRLASGQDSPNAAGTGDRSCSSPYGSVDDSGRKHIFASQIKARKGDVFLIDLRPLRARIETLSWLDSDVKRLINQFDAYMALPDVNVAPEFNNK